MCGAWLDGDQEREYGQLFKDKEKEEEDEEQEENEEEGEGKRERERVCWGGDIRGPEWGEREEAAVRGEKGRKEWKGVGVEAALGRRESGKGGGRERKRDSRGRVAGRRRREKK